ncbi:hypothetical protein [Mycobacterium simiae]|uniref:Uncharacterized protein n=1 Tax=Mycobacterium simiae TaxID=1784 RepID=A0A1X0XID2_MYCSI|nr:hypothetical protein [Mycobacterium simiae]ORJ52607.1 hypothetical protein B5M45_30950 [Mycobacterium simiae]
MYPVTIPVFSPEPPHTGDFEIEAQARKFRRDCGDIGYAEPELHFCNWPAPGRKKLKDSAGLADMTVDYVWSAWLVVVEQGDAYGAVERCGLFDIGHEEGDL